MIYRDREKPREVPAALLEHWTYFISNPPTWTDDPILEERYERIYGLAALLRAKEFKLVCENRDKNFVYGTNWQGLTWFTPEAGDDETEPPPLTWEQPEFTGWSKGEEAIYKLLLKLAAKLS